MPAFRLILLLALLLTGPARAQDAPAATVERFLTHQALREYDEMYELLSQRSRELYGREGFFARYQELDALLQAEALEYRLDPDLTQLQGHAAAVTYDLTLAGTLFGDIHDPDRTMRLLREAEGWRVAWSAMDIFDGLGGGGSLRAIGRRAPRANIYDRRGQALVFQGGTLLALYLRRDEAPNEERCLDVLAATLLRQRADLVTLLGRYNRNTVFYVGEADEAAFNANADGLRAFCAIRSQQRQSRRYWHGAAISHVTGSIGQIPADELAVRQAQGYQIDDLVGLSGIEAYYENQLAGQPARTLQIIEPGGIVLRELGTSSGSPPLPLTLTIDRQLQLAASQALVEAFSVADDNWGAREVSTGAAAVVLNASDGSILALASFPAYEPDIFNPDTFCCGFISAGARITELVNDPRRPLRNRATQEQYPPGSVYKIMTTAAFAEAGFMAPDELYDCALTWDGAPFGDTVGFERPDWRLTDGLAATGPVTMAGALTSSCDPFFYEAGARLFNESGADALVTLSQEFGLGQRSGLPVFGPEAEGALPLPGSPATAINNAIGQGNVLASPLQIAQMMTAVASRGTLRQPWLLRQIGGPNDTPVLESYSAPPSREITLADSTWDVLHAGLCAVTTDSVHGTAEIVFRSAGYRACGKTGTAQTNGFPHAWFAAWAPAAEPEIIVVVIGEHSREGSEVAAPIVRRIMDDYFGVARADWPAWWHELPYIPLEIPEGATGG